MLWSFDLLKAKNNFLSCTNPTSFLSLSLSLSLCFFALLAVSFSLLFCPLNLTYFAPYVSVSISIIVLYMYPLIFSLFIFLFWSLRICFSFYYCSLKVSINSYSVNLSMLLSVCLPLSAVIVFFLSAWGLLCLGKTIITHNCLPLYVCTYTVPFYILIVFPSPNMNYFLCTYTNYLTLLILVAFFI